jgi:uncharacterized protein (DUF2141 family)
MFLEEAMKVLTLGLAAALTLGAGAAQAGEVTVKVTGVQPARGGAVYAVLQTREQFMQRAAVAGAMTTPNGPVAEFRLPNVAPGEYALSVLHDANGNRQMDTAPNGIPLEGWAMPHAEGLNHRPGFDEVKVAVPATGASLSAAMVYMDGRIPGQAGR